MADNSRGIRTPKDQSITTRGYQREMLEESLRRNIIIAMDTGSGKTHVAVLRMKIESERELNKVSWFLAPTVALCEQQQQVIQTALSVSVGLISGSNEPEHWKDAALWRSVLNTHRVVVTTPQVLLDALRHSYVKLGQDIGLLVFDEAHHAVEEHPYNRIMVEFYFECHPRTSYSTDGHFSAQDNVRPMILGLTASPIYGGNVAKGFQNIEKNLNCTICAPILSKEELAQFVHRPIFKHVLYRPDPGPFSTNLAAFAHVFQSMDIEDDPYVLHMRKELQGKVRGTAEHSRLDQRLSKTISRKNSYTHASLQDVYSTASALLADIGPWAADWYICRAVQEATTSMSAYGSVAADMSKTEKGYLAKTLSRITLTPVSYCEDDIVEEVSDKLRVLVNCILDERAEAEANNESWNALVFVERREAVLALAEVLAHHPQTKDVLKVGCLVGSAGSGYRTSALDITRTSRKSQSTTLAELKGGEKNIIVSTAVAEEGIDIQACGSVIRWDPPPNMASWVQSRGRARRERSTFTLMFENDGRHQKTVKDWETMEQQMVALYSDPSRHFKDVLEEECSNDDDELEFRVPSTGALLTLHSAISHLNHFCAVIPNTGHTDHRPLYDIDPPDLPEGWHSFDGRSSKIEAYPGPWGAKVTLPRLLPSNLRFFETPCIHSTKTSAYRHAAFIAYQTLYHQGLLNDSLLPLTSVIEPELEEEVKALLQEVEKRAGTAKVSLQMNPWMGPPDEPSAWYSSELTISGLPPLLLLTRSKPIHLSGRDAPTLYRPGRQHIVTWQPLPLDESSATISKAREYTRRLFWCMNGSRMVWEDLDFAYLFLPRDADNLAWDARRLWHTRQNPDGEPFFTNALSFGNQYSYPTDLTIVRNGPKFSKAFKFVRWQFEPLSAEEEAELRATYSRFTDLEITYPLLVVQPFPPRTNFLIPIPESASPPAPPKLFRLLPRLSNVILCSEAEVQYALLLPSALRSLAMTVTANSLRETLFPGLKLSTVPLQLLTTAICAPMSQERTNYQRLETLGDTVLKFMVTIQLLGEYPLWHEGYLTQKMGHSVSNVKLAKANVHHRLYQWIIRDRLLGKKWKPSYFTSRDNLAGSAGHVDAERETKSTSQDLSTKVLADVVESLIGAAYLHGSFDLALTCARLFDLGVKWEPLPSRIEAILGRIETHSELPSQLDSVERMLGYTFTHKLLLVEALTHASYQQDLNTISYERLEFCGDAVLDMIVNDYLYRAVGKEYSPGHMFHRKSAIVNAHTLGFICLKTYTELTASMPQTTSTRTYMRGATRNFELQTQKQPIYLWQCLMHSSVRILDDQQAAFARFCNRREEIEEILQQGDAFPWAPLVQLQAPKFLSDMVESLTGAVFLDSRGDLDVVRGVLRKLGLLPMLERIVVADMDVLHPVSRLHMWASKRGVELDYKYTEEKGRITCVVTVDGDVVDESLVAEEYTGKVRKLTRDEVRLVAADKAIKHLRLRNVNANYTKLKGKSRPTSKKRKRST
ncbi:hypothetical protein GGX14DRAFT_418753 [Mycena pura]|uniref:P-loop containing nucleoside triphosphate hydrolase protein n=1 Tax=Mycena pura TaxID=153505 RepID=A0AAD6YRK5_9AGAR|nr:hypothetical protein GGX14DRAFT_418753 [Mycena pura]